MFDVIKKNRKTIAGMALGLGVAGYSAYKAIFGKDQVEEDDTTEMVEFKETETEETSENEEETE